ncbi:MAG: FAD-dependent oxidoreductase, partial [Calditrichia bacterium]
VPFYGQGMNCAFEDCAIFAECLDEHGDDWETVFSAYEKARKADADAIADLALNNFIEMRDSVADPVFLMKKKLELRLEEAFPGRFISTYGMVTFHRVPYARALNQGALQEKVLMDICRNATSLESIDLNSTLEQVERYLAEHI